MEQRRKEWDGTDIILKERLKSGTSSYYQEHVLSHTLRILTDLF